MTPITALDPESHSPDIVAENLGKLAELFPEAFTEGQVDFEVLKQLLGAAVDPREEKYGLNWHGKRQSRQLALTPSTGTLRPCPEESVDWDTTQNLMIEGDNLEVLKLLQKSYAGKVKLIYIDPPYNTGKDFIYPDNFRDSIKNYLEITGQSDTEGKPLSTNAETSGRFHTDWLNMMYPRLKLARNLLRDDGLIFVSIDDTESPNLRKLLDDIFGEECFVAELVWKNKYNAGALTRGFSSVHEYVLCYCRTDISNLTAPLGEPEIAQYKGIDSKVATRGGYVTQPLATSSKDERPNLRYPIRLAGKEIWPDKQWIWSRERVEAAIANDEVVLNETGGKLSVRVKQYLKDERGNTREMKPLSIMAGPYNQAGTKETEALFGAADVFPFPKPVELLRYFIALSINDEKDKSALVLDFFAGSGTAGHAVMEQNSRDFGARRFILVQLPDSTGRADYPAITDITKERLRRAGAKVREENPMFAGDLGFRVFKLDSSNIKAWDPNRDDLGGALQESIEHLKADRSESDILYEVLLKLGLDLSVPIEERVIAGKAVHSVGAGTLLVCLATDIALAGVEALALGIAAWLKELAPAGEPTAVFRDRAFRDDVAKANCAAILEQHGFAAKNVRSL